MLDPTFSRWVEALSDDEHFENVMSISERQEDEGYDAESVLRYLSIVNSAPAGLQRIGDVGDFITASMRGFIADDEFDRDAEEIRFRGVFATLDAALGADAFRRYDPVKKRHSGRFSVSAFEAISSGLAKNWPKWESMAPEEREPRIRQIAAALWADEVFDRRAGGGKAAERRIPYMVEVGERLFQVP